MIFYDIEEVEKILNNVKYIRILIAEQSIWKVKKIFFNYKNLIEISLDEDEKIDISTDMKVICKTSDKLYEYVFEGTIKEICEYKPITASIELSVYNKYVNNRKNERYDVDINTTIDKDECTIKNISKSGARIVSNYEYKDEFYLNINNLKIRCKIARKNKYNVFDYGVYFMDLDNKIDEEIQKLISSLGGLDEYSKYINKKENGINKKIFIYSKELEFTRTINKVLFSFKAYNADLFYNYDFVIDLYEKEKPNLVLLNCIYFDDNIKKLSNKISKLYNDINIFIFIDMDNQDEDLKNYETEKIHFIYKPFFAGEIEELFYKYL